MLVSAALCIRGLLSQYPSPIVPRVLSPPEKLGKWSGAETREKMVVVTTRAKAPYYIHYLVPSYWLTNDVTR